MYGKIIGFLREYIFILSIVTMVFGFFFIIFGSLGIWYVDGVKNLLNIDDGILIWCPYIFLIGLLIFVIGFYYIYGYIKNKNFLLREIKTKKRSEFIKIHMIVRDKVRYLPSKYKKMLYEKEKELKIK